MKLVKSTNVIGTNTMQIFEYIRGVNFLEKQQCDIFLKALDYDIKTIQELFDKIEVEYDDIKLEGVTVSYRVNNEWLSLADLSSGERNLLYLLACKRINKKVVLWGLFERLGDRLTNLALEELKDYENLIIVVCNVILPREYGCLFIKELT